MFFKKFYIVVSLNILFFLLALIGWGSSVRGSLSQSEIKGKCTRVSDGDTIVVQVNGLETKVRLSYIDCPERSQGKYGTEAFNFTKSLVLGKDVSIVLTNSKLDKYNRVIALVYVSGTNECLNYSLVDAGLAWAYIKYVSDKDLAIMLENKEEKARQEKKGLWVEDNPIAPWDYRKMKYGETEKEL